ncbi:MAG: ATP-grasp domain-containing protein [Oscillospiraceae bacterium]|jgi:carbamoylphosphate synthase large subunit|nr:ATP-grasp domain-containing protein [Oscillospiraceae bacterium]
MKKIYLNRFFSTAYYLIEWLKRGGFYVIASGVSDSTVYKNIADEYFVEDNLSGVEERGIVDYYTLVLNEHKPDAFLPYSNLETIVRHKADIERDTGVKIIADDFSVVGATFAKSGTYTRLKNLCPEFIPPYFIAETRAEFENAVREISEYARPCFKFDTDIGAGSFRVIDDVFFAVDEFPPPLPNLKTTYNAALKGYNGERVIVMPYMSEPEISVDCLRTPNGNIIIPRVKRGGRIEQIGYDREIMLAAKKILGSFRPEYPFNIQFRFFKDELKLLEINPRLSGSSHISAQAGNVNIPAIAARKALDLPVRYEGKFDMHEKFFSYVEMPVDVTDKPNTNTEYKKRV